MEAAAAGVWACIVCYGAEPPQLARLVEALAPQVGRVLVMDNAADARLRAVAQPRADYHAMPANLGTAGALNRAWQLALAAGADALLSLDQDSIPSEGMVAHLADTLARLRAQGVAVAAVGPLKVDPRNGRAGRLLAPVRFVRHFARADGTQAVEVDHLITSGCLTPAQTYRQVGPYNEQLFLDYVDIEWSLRARAQGLRLFCDTGTALSHTIGEQVVDVGPRTLSLHSPLRTFLLVRNHLLLWREGAIPRPWLASDALQVFKKAAGLLVLAPQRGARLRAIAHGLVQGLRGRGGPP
jgi:rhamnosyltransferase